MKVWNEQPMAARNHQKLGQNQYRLKCNAMLKHKQMCFGKNQRTILHIFKILRPQASTILLARHLNQLIIKDGQKCKKEESSRCIYFLSTNYIWARFSYIKLSRRKEQIFIILTYKLYNCTLFIRKHQGVKA